MIIKTCGRLSGGADPPPVTWGRVTGVPHAPSVSSGGGTVVSTSPRFHGPPRREGPVVVIKIPPLILRVPGGRHGFIQNPPRFRGPWGGPTVLPQRRPRLEGSLSRPLFRGPLAGPTVVPLPWDRRSHGRSLEDTPLQTRPLGHFYQHFLIWFMFLFDTYLSFVTKKCSTNFQNIV